MVLYVVPTPIGNIKDITYRAIEVLNECDIILCEDTRYCLKLLNYFNIKKKMIPYHKFNEFKLLDRVVKDIVNGNKYCLISDAGMPGISDPGKLLINECIKNNIKVDVLPGACALINGVVLNGFENEPFTFLGFLPRVKGKCVELLNKFRDLNTILVIYESPHRFLFTINLIREEFGDECLIYIGRELTKMFEENFRGNVKEAISHFEISNVKGEFVICIKNISKNEKEISSNEILQIFNENKENLNLTMKDNVKKICEEYGLKKNYVYDLVLNESKKQPHN